jgi:hypothetical protein
LQISEYDQDRFKAIFPKLIKNKKKLPKILKMEITNEDIEVMMIWIERIMKLDVWYPVKSAKAEAIIRQIMDENIYPGLEFGQGFKQIRVVENL